MKIAIQCKCGETFYVEADMSAGPKNIDTLARCVRCWKCTTSMTKPELYNRMQIGTFAPIKPYRAPYAD